VEVGGKNAHFISITVGHGVIAAGYLYFKPNGSEPQVSPRLAEILEVNPRPKPIAKRVENVPISSLSDDLKGGVRDFATQVGSFSSILYQIWSTWAV
jgi:hypothetical protein